MIIDMDLPTLPVTSKKILLVENDPLVRQTLAQQLEIEGYLVYQAVDGLAALEVLENHQPELILSEIEMPGMDGVAFYRALRRRPGWVTIPFIFLSPKDNPSTARAGRELGVEDYLYKPVEPAELTRVVSTRLLRSAELRVAHINQAYLETVDVLANTIETRDPYTLGHVSRVTGLARSLAEALNWPQENLRALEFGARLHDIGKIIIPDTILRKPGPLSPDELELIKQHPVAGARILRSITHLQSSVAYVLYHHERWDGSGYPYGLKGHSIPLEGRLMAIVDVYDALITERSYHPARSPQEVVQFLHEHSGTHFDPDLTAIFIEMVGTRSYG